MSAFHYHIAMLCYWCLECTSGMFLHSNNQSLSSYQKSGTQLYTWCPLTLAKHWPSRTNCCLAYLPIISLYFFKIRRSHGPPEPCTEEPYFLFCPLSWNPSAHECFLVILLVFGRLSGFLWRECRLLMSVFFVYLHSGCVLKPCWGCLYCFPS